MSRYGMLVILLSIAPGFVWAAADQSSVVNDLEADCTLTAPGPNQIKTCTGPAGYQAVMHQTPMGEQLTLENTGIAFSAAVIRCERGQRITSLVWRLRKGKPFAVFVGYACRGFRGQSTPGVENRILVQGLKGFEEYGHEVRVKTGVPTVADAERLADSWLKSN